ncbi:hypothetical protein CLV31_1185 [Algoriphagus aquaeductus]|uniref:Uncharacterized protein n=1 Tax=Algoriphagus aquaeductus TaxID=475299 RepID=A0A326RVW9_9BACT|nr:hypothetical protein CLV31_1185 [Algoriphagus aquaeductus]
MGAGADAAAGQRLALCGGSFLPHLLAQKLSFLPFLDLLVLLGQAKRTKRKRTEKC